MLVAIVILLTTGTNGRADETPLLSGESLRKSLDAPFLISFENLALGELLREIETTYGIPIVLDRRIDPNQLVNHSGSGGTQRAFLLALAERIEAGAAFLDGAGIDLDATVKVDVKDVDAQSFFDAVFKPLGLKVELDGVTVTLTPAS